MSKWTYEKLMEDWSALVKRSTDRAQFNKERDAMIEESGWTKLEFYSETDRRALEQWKKAIQRDAELD